MPINSPDVFDSIGDAIISGGGGGGGVSTFIALNDTPSSYSIATRGFLVAQNNSDNGVEFIDPSTVGTTSFLGLTDTPSSYSGQGGKVVAVVSPAENALIFTESLTASLDGQKIKFDVRGDTYGATGDHEGELLKIGSAATTQGDVLYWNGTDWAQAQANAVATSTGLIAIAHTTTSPATAGVLHQGFVQLTGNPGGSAGDVLYLDDSGAARMTQTAPTASGSIVRIMGYNIDGAGLVYFNPSADWLEIV